MRQADMFTKTTKEVAEYAGRKLKYSADIRKAIEDLETPIIAEPTDPALPATMTQRRIWEKGVDEHMRRLSMLRQDLETMYSVILGQCTDAMRARLESEGTFVQVARDSDAVELLKLIRGIAFNFQSQKYETLSVHEAVSHLVKLHQGKYTTCQGYLEHFNNAKDVLDHCGGTITAHPGLVASELVIMGTTIDVATREQVLAATAMSQEKYMAVMFIMGADRERYSELIIDLENDFLKGNNEYTCTRRR